MSENIDQEALAKSMRKNNKPVTKMQFSKLAGAVSNLILEVDELKQEIIALKDNKVEDKAEVFILPDNPSLDILTKS